MLSPKYSIIPFTTVVMDRAPEIGQKVDLRQVEQG